MSRRVTFPLLLPLPLSTQHNQTTLYPLQPYYLLSYLTTQISSHQLVEIRPTLKDRILNKAS